MPGLKRAVQVKIPFAWLWNDYLDLFGEHGLNPEIGLDAHSLEKYTRTDFAKAATTFQ